jgi:Flp pilus assembly protein TadB
VVRTPAFQAGERGFEPRRPYSFIPPLAAGVASAAVADASWLLAAMGGVVGGVAAEIRTQRRVARGLAPAEASRWDALGGFERYRVGRELRRGRAIDDPALGSQVAAALREQLERRRLALTCGALALLFAVLVVLALAGGSVVLAAVEAVIVACLAALPLWQRHVRRRLGEAEDANRRALYEA